MAAAWLTRPTELTTKVTRTNNNRVLFLLPSAHHCPHRSRPSRSALPLFSLSGAQSPGAPSGIPTLLPPFAD
ncbi:hypothetical protein DL93DRAFT_2076045 [Clavulina sp. PMI_390]|nr:hypothetical protein DL93DRAFT_2076045 [Clavulina sp. PMI_390]